MPQQTFEITAPNGKVLEITGDRMPNEGEIRSIFKKAGVDVQAPRVSAPREPGLATIGEQMQAKAEHPHARVGRTVRDLASGAAKGVGSTVFGLGKLVRDYTPVGRISDAIMPGAFDQKPPEIVPNNTAQKIGFAAEQMGEFLVPAGAVSKLGKAGEVARAVGTTMAQSGSPAEAGVSGAITAVLPGAKMAQTASGALRESAEKSMAQALGATKEKFKEEAARLAPEMLERGIKGTRAQMLDRAKKATSAVGKELDDAYAAAAQAGDTVAGDVVRGHLQLTRDALKIKNAAGQLIAIPGTERVISKLDELDDFVKALGPDVPVDKAAQVKRTFDKIVDKAGLFGPKATASATDNADAWAIREASGAFRELLNRNPSIAELNAEFAFQNGLRKVLKETQKRTQTQRGGLTDAVRSAAGATMGAAVGGPVGAAVGAVGMEALSRAWNSPAFKTAVAGPFKNQMAEALASGSAGKILSVVRKVAASTPAMAQ